MPISPPAIIVSTTGSSQIGSGPWLMPKTSRLRPETATLLAPPKDNSRAQFSKQNLRPRDQRDSQPFQRPLPGLLGDKQPS